MLPSDLVPSYQRDLRKITTAAQDRLGTAIDAVSLDPADKATCREVLTALTQQTIDAYSEAAMARSADFFRDAADAEGTTADRSTPRVDRDRKATAGAVRAFVGEDEIEDMRRLCLDRVDAELRGVAHQSIYDLGDRWSKSHKGSRVRYARVPTGAETCDFCTMLASRGFVYHTAKTARAEHGNTGHVHAKCDCVVVPGLGCEPDVPGYRPADLRAKYDEAVDEGRLDPYRASIADKRLTEDGAFELLAKRMGYKPFDWDDVIDWIREDPLDAERRVGIVRAVRAHLTTEERSAAVTRRINDAYRETKRV